PSLGLRQSSESSGAFAVPESEKRPNAQHGKSGRGLLQCKTLRAGAERLKPCAAGFHRLRPKACRIKTPVTMLANGASQWSQGSRPGSPIVSVASIIAPSPGQGAEVTTCPVESTA